MTPSIVIFEGQLNIKSELSVSRFKLLLIQVCFNPSNS